MCEKNSHLAIFGGFCDFWEENANAILEIYGIQCSHNMHYLNYRNYLISWCESFVEAQGFRRVLRVLLETLRKLYVSTKFPHQETRWSFGVLYSDRRHLTFSWRRPISYRNQSIDLWSKSMDWFLYDNDLRHEKVNWFALQIICLVSKWL